MFPESWDLWAILAGIAVSAVVSAIGGVVFGGAIALDTAREAEDEAFETAFEREFTAPATLWRMIAIATVGIALSGAVTGRLADSAPVAHGLVLGIALAGLTFATAGSLPRHMVALSALLALPAASLGAWLVA